MIALLSVAFAEITLEVPPVTGVETVVVVQDVRGEPRGGQTVRVIHRPGLAAEQELAVGITDGRGRIRWTPSATGVAWIRAGDEILPLRVAGPAPGSALLLGIALLVGSSGAFVRGVVPRMRR